MSPTKEPYEVLGLTPDYTAEQLRQRYLELVRQNPPEREPEKFAEIRAAYAELNSPVKRWEDKLFYCRTEENLPVLVADLRSRTIHNRIPVRTLLSLADLT